MEEEKMRLSLTDRKLQIEFEWYEQIWAVRLDRVMEIPIAHIRSMTTTEPQSSWAELRAPGTFLPGVIKAGTYYTKQGKEFWYVTDDRNYLTLELEDEPYRRLVLTIPEHQAWYDRINSELTIDSRSQP
jgi:hypothetical protein